MAYKNLIIALSLLCWPVLSMADQIDELYAAYPAVSITMQVKNIKTGEELYSRNSKRLLVPASVTKVFTAYAALSHLGADFTYATQILESNGDIYLKFSGDPSFKGEDLQQLLSKLPQRYAKKKIFIDDFAFDQNYRADGWVWDDGKFCFAAPVSAIIVDRNCFAGTLEATGVVVADKVFAKISNDLISKNDANCAPDLKANPDNSYNLTGCVNSSEDPAPLNIAYQDPRLMIRDMVKDALNKPDMEVLFKPTPAAYKVIAIHRSKALAELVKVVQKDSDNIYANSITKTIGASYYKTQGSFKNGIMAMQEIDKFENIVLFDGAGGSRYNLISPEQLVNLFIKAYRDKKTWPYFRDSLAVSAIDGSLEKRFGGHKELHGKIQAKTGGMKGVSTIVGCFQDKVFAVMINGFTGTMAEKSELTDKITKAILLDLS